MAEVNKDQFKSSPYQISTDIQQPQELKDREREKRKHQQRRAEEDGPKSGKKSLGSKIAERFLAIDRDDVKNHLLYDWLFPEIIDMVSNLLSQLFLGSEYSGRMSSARKKKDKDGYTPYDKRFGSGNTTKIAVLDDNFRHITLGCEKKAPLINLLDYLRDEIEETDGNNVTVKDLFNYKDINANTHYKMGEYGWFDLEDNVDIISKRGSWEMVMPPAQQLLRKR